MDVQYVFKDLNSVESSSQFISILTSIEKLYFYAILMLTHFYLFGYQLNKFFAPLWKAVKTALELCRSHASDDKLEIYFFLTTLSNEGLHSLRWFISP